MTDPDGARWRWYVKTGHTDQHTNQVAGEGETAMCCAPDGVVRPPPSVAQRPRRRRVLLSPAA